MTDFRVTSDFLKITVPILPLSLRRRTVTRAGLGHGYERTAQLRPLRRGPLPCLALR